MLQRSADCPVNRRQLVLAAATLAAHGLTGAFAAVAQPMTKRQIGILMPYAENDPVVQRRVAAFKDEMAKLGWTNGMTVEFQERWTTDALDAIRAAAGDLTARNLDAIITTGSRVVPILQRSTTTIPIVFVGTSDPAGQGFVASTSRPGGNTTGFSLQPFEHEDSPLMGKLFDFMIQIAPGTRRMALMFNPANPANSFNSRTFNAVARIRGIDGVTVQVRDPAEIEAAVQTLARDPDVAIILPSDLTLLGQRHAVVEILARHRMPAIFSDASFVEIGGLISYSADRTHMFRASASYVDRILRGEKPGDLPVQQPTRYELSVNLKTAKALGLTIPPSVLVSAHEVIE